MVDSGSADTSAGLLASSLRLSRDMGLSVSDHSPCSHTAEPVHSKHRLDLKARRWGSGVGGDEDPHGVTAVWVEKEGGSEPSREGSLSRMRDHLLYVDAVKNRAQTSIQGCMDEYQFRSCKCYRHFQSVLEPSRDQVTEECVFCRAPAWEGAGADRVRVG